jgi:hypothetical protein
MIIMPNKKKRQKAKSKHPAMSSFTYIAEGFVPLDHNYLRGTNPTSSEQTYGIIFARDADKALSAQIETEKRLDSGVIHSFLIGTGDKTAMRVMPIDKNRQCLLDENIIYRAKDNENTYNHLVRMLKEGQQQLRKDLIVEPPGSPARQSSSASSKNDHLAYSLGGLSVSGAPAPTSSDQPIRILIAGTSVQPGENQALSKALESDRIFTFDTSNEVYLFSNDKGYELTQKKGKGGIPRTWLIEPGTKSFDPCRKRFREDGIYEASAHRLSKDEFNAHPIDGRSCDTLENARYNNLCGFQVLRKNGQYAAFYIEPGERGYKLLDAGLTEAYRQTQLEGKVTVQPSRVAQTLNDIQSRDHKTLRDAIKHSTPEAYKDKTDAYTLKHDRTGWNVQVNHNGKLQFKPVQFYATEAAAAERLREKPAFFLKDVASSARDTNSARKASTPITYGGQQPSTSDVSNAWQVAYAPAGTFAAGPSAAPVQGTPFYPLERRESPPPPDFTPSVRNVAHAESSERNHGKGKGRAG